MRQKKLVTGILAHVDAGKTTLAESILYLRGKIRKAGRVDHGDTYLDTHELERSRGITIFSKQAEVSLKEKEITLLDTPGHVDFSAEMERTLQVLDYAILIISGPDKVQGHVQTLWKLLDKYHVPVFIFVNKMDQSGVVKEEVLSDIQNRLDKRCIEFVDAIADETFQENLAVCKEELLEKYLEGEEISFEEIQRLIKDREVFPCFFGSALKMQGVEQFLDAFDQYTMAPEYGESFSAKVYKISRDKQGVRQTHMKITGGSLKVKMPVKDEEKVDQIRIYSGTSFTPVSEACAGTVCAVTGLTTTYSGEGLGEESDSDIPVLEPVLTYRIALPKGSDVHGTFLKLKQLEEEEPELHIVWNEVLNEIHAQVMGEIQIEILKSMIQTRFDLPVEFDKGNIVYKESIEEEIEGAGHFEPLRHYAEVRLLLRPAKRGSGLHFSTECKEDVLDKNWQRLILTHLMEKNHKGVLTGADITDMEIVLVAGRAHKKHTEGGDFRQATYRAVRQGLRKAKSILLEPVYEFELEVPSEMVGRAMTDIQKMYGNFSAPQIEGETAILKGTAPVVTMRDYYMDVISYTKGQGRLYCDLKGYEPCHNSEEVILEAAYDPEADLYNPTGSVFCAHGAGFNVNWDEVEEYMHTESVRNKKKVHTEKLPSLEPFIDEEELKEIFDRTYHANKKEKTIYKKKIDYSYTPSSPSRSTVRKKEKQFLLVDGYNIIFAWEELKELSKINIEAARNKLMDILSNYQGYKKMTLILVFDAYKVNGNPGEITKYHNIYVVYTKEAETADQYIEKTVHEIGRQYEVTVATSDSLEQVIILGQGAQRISAKGLLEEINATNQEIRMQHLNQSKKSSRYLFEDVSEEVADLVEDVRMGRKEL